MNRWVLSLAALLLAGCARDPMDDPEYAAACHGPPVHGVEKRNEAYEQGYTINQRFDCIDKKSWEEVQRAHELVAGLVQQAERELSAAPQAPRSLAVARRGFATGLSTSANGLPLPTPPANLFVRSDYQSPGIGKLPAWITPDPGDGEKHPAIVWITGGDSNSLDDFWSAGSPDNDQSASAWRRAGMIMMFPTLRGGNTNGGKKEYFLGEVDDVIAAARHAASLPYVDRVFIGGHSTGGTLALLVAESSEEFAGVFAFGPVADVTQYPHDFVPLDFRASDDRERELRSPIHWLEGIGTPTYLIEGREPPGNIASLEALCAKTRNPKVKCVPVPGMNHFSVLDAVSKKLAARIVVGGGADNPPLVTAEEFSRSTTE